MLVNKYLFKSLQALECPFDELKHYKNAFGNNDEFLSKWWGEVNIDNVYMLSEPVIKTIESNGAKMMNVAMNNIEPCEGFFLTKSDFAIAYSIKREQDGVYCTLICFEKGYVVLSGVVVFLGVKNDTTTFRCSCGNAPCGKKKVEEMLMIEARTVICIETFLRYAKVEQIIIEHGQRRSKDNKKLPVENFTGYPIRYVDSTWVREIIRTEGFTVRGHFRMQPKKVNGEWTKELIYINEFEKHGYHRRAGIERQSDCK